MAQLKRMIFGSDHPLIRNTVSTAILFFALFTMDAGFRYIYSFNDAEIVKGWVPLLLSAFWCMLLCCISLLLPRIIRRIYNVVITLVYALLVTIQAFYFSFFGSYMSVSSVIFAGEGADFFDWSYITIPKKLIAMLALQLILSVISVLIIPKTKYSLKTLCTVVALAASVAGINAVSRVAFSEKGYVGFDSVAGIADVYDSFTDTKACMHMAGLFHYTFRDISVTTGFDSLLSTFKYSELDDYYEEKDTDADNEMTGIFKDKNLILIQLESIDSWAVNDIAMPNLKRIQSESISFTNFYTPGFLVGATFNTENIVNTGLISPPNSGKLSYFTENTYPYSAANLFKKEGYSVNSFHRSYYHVYNRGEVHTNWGYEKYVCSIYLEIDDIDLDSTLPQAYDKFTSDDKFMSFIITYTGHGPFTEDTKPSMLYYDEIAAQLPEGTDEEYICSLCHAHDTDVFIGKLFKKLEDDGHIDDTVVIMYADHYNRYLTNEELLAELEGTDDINMMGNVPFIIYSKDMEPMTVEKTVASYDVLPTIANLFDLDTDGRYYVGNDAFGDGGGYVIFSDRSWYDGKTYFKVYESEETELSKSRGEEITERLNASYNTVRTNYFKHSEEK